MVGEIVVNWAGDVYQGKPLKDNNPMVFHGSLAYFMVT